LDAFRTFGLDRISAITFTDNQFEREKKRMETAQLRFSPLMVKHLSALPLHHSQTIDENTVTLQVIVNPELENKLLSYGEHLEVLSPDSLREKIKQRLIEALTRYR
jgi:predicted DNA-binding transcriptional regulator YafY